MATYSCSWFNPTNFELLKQFEEKENINFLEIGSFEGMSANFFVDHYLTGKNSFITCIDPWIKYSESTITKMAEWDDLINETTFEIFTKNTLPNKDKIIVKRGLSSDILPTLEKIYHFVYIDGDHSEKAVWLDAVLSFKVLLVGGIMIFDDYTWNEGDKSPKNAIDKFLCEYKDYIRILHIDYQVVLEKVETF